MDGIHDMGGTQGWGTVAIDPDEPVFEEPGTHGPSPSGWPSMGASGTNLDAFRHALERLHPREYLADGYYGRWLAAAETLLVDSGVLAPGAVEARARSLRGEDVAEPADARACASPSTSATAPGSLRQIDDQPAFEVGAAGPGQDLHKPARHTRLPRYVARHGSAWSTAPSRPPCCPTPTPTSPARTPSTSTPCASTSTELWGAGRRALRPLASTSSRATWRRPRECRLRTADRPPAALRAEALESLLIERGLVEPEVLDEFINRYENDVGPLNGAKVVAKAWVDPDYRPAAARGRHRRHRRARLRRARRASTSWWSRTPTTSTTSSCARCAPATRGRCSACRPTGTRTRPTARGSCASRGRCWPRWASPLDDDVEIKVWDSQLRGPLLRAARAPGRHRGPVRGGAGRPGHPRRHGRRRRRSRSPLTRESSSPIDGPAAPPRRTASWSSTSRGRAGRSAWRPRSRDQGRSRGRTSSRR